MRPRLYVKLLWFAILVAISVFINCPVEAAGFPHSSSSDKILQFTSGGHVLGFGTEGVYVASGSHALHVQFVNARKTNPVSDGPSGKGLTGDTQRAAPLSRVTYANLWDGVTLTYDASGGAVLRSTYRIDAYASPENIRLRYNAPVSVESDGSLHISFQTGAMNEGAPQAWQERGGKRVPIRIAFLQRAKAEIGFVAGEYDRSEPLFIDPTLTWTTFLGGSGADYGYAVAVDGSGNVYVAGLSSASWGSPLRAFSGSWDAFAAKLDSSGNLIWNTFLGGSGYDVGWAVAVDGSGNVYVAGDSNWTWGSPVRAYSSWYDAFVAKLDSSGNLIWNTFLGGSGIDSATGVAVDGNRNVYVVGSSYTSWGSPIRAFSSGGDAFAAKLDSSGNLIWNTFLGGSGATYGFGVALDGSGNAYVSGLSSASWGSPVRAYGGGNYDAFVAKLDSSGNLIWNTFLGGSGADYGRALALDGSGNIFVEGYSSASWGSPVRTYGGGSYEVFAAKLDSSGNLIWNTFLGSVGGLPGYPNYGVAVDGSGNVYVAGCSGASWGSPVRAFSSNNDAFAAQLDSSGNLIWNTFLGGGGDDQGSGVAVDGSGNIYVVGSSGASWGSPVRAYGGGDYDAFVAKIFANTPDSVGPIVSGVTASPNPVGINAGITLTATVSDSTTGGSNIASAGYNIDGGSFIPMNAVDLAFDQVSEDVSALVTPFSEAGLHTLCVQGTDAAGNVGASQCTTLVVYDPTGGFVTGGGAVDSPAGADLADTSAAGLATFGFNSKYLPGRNTPDGNLEFQFKAGNLNFKSTIMDWLVVTGEPRAIFRGFGTINGATVCKFEVDAWDGSFSSSKLDAFGLKIFSCAGGGDRYNLAATPLKQGNIIIHK